MAGADMLKSGVFTTERAKQLLDRSRYLRLEPYTKHNKGHAHAGYAQATPCNPDAA